MFVDRSPLAARSQFLLGVMPSEVTRAAGEAARDLSSGATVVAGEVSPSEVTRAAGEAVRNSAPEATVVAGAVFSSAAQCASLASLHERHRTCGGHPLSTFRRRRFSGTRSCSPQPRQTPSARSSADLSAGSAVLSASGVFVASRLVLPAAGAWLRASGASPRSFLVGGSSGPAGASTGVVASRPVCSACCRAVVRALRHRRFQFRLARARSPAAFRFSLARPRSPAACRSCAGGETLGAGAVFAVPGPGRPWSGGIRRASARSHCFRRLPMASNVSARS